MAYTGSAGTPPQFMSAEDLAAGTGSNVHNQDETVGAPNPVTPPYTDNPAPGGRHQFGSGLIASAIKALL